MNDLKSFRLSQRGEEESIFNAITEIDDEVSYFINNDDDDDDDPPPATFSTLQLLERYIKSHRNYHVSILTLLKMIFDLKEEEAAAAAAADNFPLHFYQLFLPPYTSTHTVSLI